MVGGGGNTNIVFWAPNINLAKNFLWCVPFLRLFPLIACNVCIRGRNQETPGEDPLINGLYAHAFISEMQGGGSTTSWNATPGTKGGMRLKTATTIKHYIA